ncbi:glucosyltransferase [Actinorhabdospora filicis]|uniref:Glucosyltransferase n=1 Tax=Actinorhabdospora filicis TaxID=1785913 RepID=A0A9W6WB00_9ACTN|nr:glycosyltransferase family 4 protein [Actinorhabdospora filicis]GLZ79101.1 glucosyltransferase [Actinorhabdospora filicis]
MRIAVVNNFFPPRTGGSAHLSESLAKGYAARGHDVLVIAAAYGGAPAVEERDGIRIVRLPSWQLPQTRLAVSFDILFATRPGIWRRVKKVLGEFRPDVVHQHGQFFDLTWATGLWARKKKVPTLLSVHTRLENPQASYHGVFRALDAMMVRPPMKLHKPRLVVMDVLMDEYIKARYKKAYAGLDYIPVGVEPDWTLGGDPALVRERHGLGDAPLILSIGHVIPLRDRVTLVESLPKVLAEFPDAKLLVVGRTYFDAYQKRAQQLGVTHAIVEVGVVPKSDIPHYLAAASVESHEQGFGLGTATLEAMAAGVPVVAPARADNFPGIDLVDGGNIWLTPLGDSDAMADNIIAVLRDPAHAKEVALAGQALIREHFTMDRVLDKHLEVLGRLAGE